MPNKKSRVSGQERFLAVIASFEEAFPQISAWCADEEDFSELRLKLRDDSSVLAIAKGYGSDGTPMVCFGVGYGVVGALLGLEGSIQGNNWRVDKPWAPS